MRNIIINVKDKIAEPAENYNNLVCGNVYTITFSFDSEWDDQLIKTVRFTYVKDGVEQTIDKTMPGNVVETPIFSNITSAKVGVFAGNLETTTPAELILQKSILCGGNLPDNPDENIYNEIVELCSKAVTTAEDVERRANNGEFNGRNGAPGTPGKDGEDGNDYILTKYDKEEISDKIMPDVAELIKPDVAELIKPDVAELIKPDVAEAVKPEIVEELTPIIAAGDIFGKPYEASVILKNSQNEVTKDHTFVTGWANKVKARGGFVGGESNEAPERTSPQDYDHPVMGGMANKSYNVFSILFGQGCKAYSPYGTAIGYACIAGDESRQNDHNRFDMNNCIGAFAQGWETHATHAFTAVYGFHTRSSAPYQTIFGKLNADNPNAILIIGNGSSTSNRSNALEITKTGQIIIGGITFDLMGFNTDIRELNQRLSFMESSTINELTSQIQDLRNRIVALEGGAVNG